MMCFGAKEVMSFLGRNLSGRFRGEQVNDLTDRCKHRLPGVRIKHRMQMNWQRMCDKAGSVLQVEMVINDPEAFRARRQVKREGESVTQWVPMSKGVANLFRYRDVSMAANSRYLEALTVVENPTPALRNLDRICERKRNRRGKSVRAFSPLAREERQLFQALLGGEHQVRGFSNRDVRGRLTELKAIATKGKTAQRLSAVVSRRFSRLHVYGLIARVPRSRRWRLTKVCLHVFASAIRIREQLFPDAYLAGYA